MDLYRNLAFLLIFLIDILDYIGHVDHTKTVYILSYHKYFVSF